MTRTRIKFSKITMEIAQGNNSKLIIFRSDRSDLPHLTVSWGNPSREVDIHLKRRTSGGSEKPTPIAKIPESEITSLLKSFEPEYQRSIETVLPKLQPVRPGWLGHKGYVVFYMDDDTQQKLIARIAPKRKHRSKLAHVVDESAIKDLSQAQEIMDCIYQPAILHNLAAIEFKGTVLAQCIRGKRKGRLLVLYPSLKANSKYCWFAINAKHIELMTSSNKFFLSGFKQLLPDDAWTTIFDALHLAELGIEREP